MTESVPGPPLSRVMSVGRLSGCAPKGRALNGDVESAPVLLPARSVGGGFAGRLPGIGAAVQTFSGGLFVCAHAVLDSREAASIVVIRRMGSTSSSYRNAVPTGKLSASPSTCHVVARPAQNADKIISRRKGEWTTMPLWVPITLVASLFQT